MSNHAATTPLKSDSAASRAPGAAGSNSAQASPEREIARSAARPWRVRAYKVSRLALDKLIVGLKALHAGFWLGLLDKEHLDLVGAQYYDEQTTYQADAYNRQGLWPWEDAMINRFFPASGRLLVAAAGGGREIFALHHRGYQVDAFECHGELVDYANRFLKGQGIACIVEHAPCDAVPSGDVRYDAVIIGWSAYMLIQGRRRRVAFLRSIRAQVASGSPLLLSFFARRRDGLQFLTVRLAANLLRVPCCRERVELGDTLAPNYVHYFTEPELSAELKEAGFCLIFYGTERYGHAVARAC